MPFETIPSLAYLTGHTETASPMLYTPSREQFDFIYQQEFLSDQVLIYMVFASIFFLVVFWLMLRYDAMKQRVFAREFLSELTHVLSNPPD